MKLGYDGHPHVAEAKRLTTRARRVVKETIPRGVGVWVHRENLDVRQFRVVWRCGGIRVPYQKRLGLGEEAGKTNIAPQAAKPRSPGRTADH